MTPKRLRIELWSWNYPPEPTGIAPVVASLGEALRDRGHRLIVVTSFPHYPAGRFRQRYRPYRESLAGIEVLRLPLVMRRTSSRGRILEEASFAVSAGLCSPFLPPSDVAVAVSPSFLGLAAVGARGRIRRIPWLLWLQDILPDAAATTGLLTHPTPLAVARWYERAVYNAADHIVAISDSFRDNLIAKGVPRSKITTIQNPATRPFRELPRRTASERRIFAMGNIGLSQGLPQHVRAIVDAGVDATIVIAGTGALEDELRRSVHSDRVEILGLVDERTLAGELERATVALVTQREDVVEFNVPSRVMSYMAEALPIVASVRTDSEVARVVSASRGGWLTSLSTIDSDLTAILGDPAELERRSLAALSYAHTAFDARSIAERFEAVLAELVAARRH